jgi:hypothetical protein
LIFCGHSLKKKALVYSKLRSGYPIARLMSQLRVFLIRMESYMNSIRISLVILDGVGIPRACAMSRFVHFDIRLTFSERPRTDERVKQAKRSVQPHVVAAAVAAVATAAVPSVVFV